jgi:hypothetical protein
MVAVSSVDWEIEARRMPAVPVHVNVGGTCTTSMTSHVLGPLVIGISSDGNVR